VKGDGKGVDRKGRCSCTKKTLVKKERKKNNREKHRREALESG